MDRYHGDLTHTLPRGTVRGALRVPRRQVQREDLLSMRPYEVMIILDPTLDDEVIRTEVDRATEQIRSRGGVAGRVERWGRRRLAYEIDHQRDGYYVVVEATAEPPVMAELDRSLLLADHVIRHKIVRIPDHVAERASRPTSTADRGPAPLAAETAATPSTDSNGA